MLEAVYCAGHCFHEVCRTHERISYHIFQGSICSVIANQCECYPKWTRVKRPQDVANQRNLSDKVAKCTLGHALRFFLQNSKWHEVTMLLKSRRRFSNTTLERMAEDSESCFGKTLCKSPSFMFISCHGLFNQSSFFQVWWSWAIALLWGFAITRRSLIIEVSSQCRDFHFPWRWWKPQVSISLDCSDHPKQS